MINSFGEYEKAKAELKDKKWRKDNLRGSSEFTWHMEQHVKLLETVLLQYRRQHNIFEVGDKVVDTNYKDSDVQEIKSISGNRMNVFHKNKAYYFATFVFSFRHATDEEIKAGRRL